MPYPEHWPCTSAMMEVLEPVPEPQGWRKANKWKNHKNKIHTPLHEHKLKKANPFSFWKCDHCKAERSANSFLFYCRRCSFSLCYSCANMHLQQNTSAHQHGLLYLESSRIPSENQNGAWRCAVCKNTSDILKQTFSYHCSTCSDFDICSDCYEPRRHPVHIHKLSLVDTSLIHAKTAGGSWVCGVCGNASRPYETFSHHCGKCDFDVCHECFKPHITPLHAHPLYRADSNHVYGRCNGRWQCNNCDSVHRNPTDNMPWHCQNCEYDLCRACISATIEATDQTGHSLENSGRNRKRCKRARSANPWVARGHLMPTLAADAAPSFVTEKDNAVAFPEDADNISVKCIICLEEPKNATLIHGDTGHCCSCWACAIVLKQRGDPCPVCRAPIKQVIRQFNA